jgi:two-component system, LytTR family, response regulator
MKTTLRCLIVDDEADARSYLRKRLQPHPELAVVGEASSVREAHALCVALRPDVVFLDVRMPLANGFELIPLLDPAPQIVFVTAYADRAVDAFQVRALDYLLKPYSAERMSETVDKLLGRGMRGQIAPPPAALKPQGSIMVRTGTALLRLNLAEIILIEADEPYSRVWVSGDTAHVVTQPMKAWTEILPPEPFCRLDRSYIVNINKVSRLHAETRSENQVSFVGLQRTINVGRAGATRLKQLLRSRDEALQA